MFEGISDIKRNQHGIQNYNFFYPKGDAEGFIKLSEICESLKNNSLGENIKLYCVFCRGSQREFKDEYGDFQNMDADQLFLNESFDFDEIPETTNSQSQYNNKNNELDSFDFDSSLFGGKRKSRRRYKRRKTVRRKTVRRKKSKRRRNI
jgi:hypothetical protein